MKIEVDLKKKYLFPAMSLLIILAGIFTVYALTTGTAPNPGHLLNQVSPPAGCQTGQVITWDGSNLICSSASSSGVTGAVLENYRGQYDDQLKKWEYIQFNTTHKKYMFSVDTATMRGTTLPINSSILGELCVDGCELTLGMTFWTSTGGSDLSQYAQASRGPYTFFYHYPSGNWRLSNTDSNGINNNGASQTVLNIWNGCILTDGAYDKYVNKNDNSDDFGIAVWNGYSGSATTCILTITN
jgi:hypothetical protein